MSDVETNRIASMPTLTTRLLCPSSMLAFVLLGLTCLPMSSCEDSDEDFVPARMALQIAGFYDDPPRGVLERLRRFFNAVPLLFTVTWPYWTALPPIVALLTLKVSRRWASIVWRILILALSVSIFALAFSLYFPFGWSAGIGSGAAIALWIRSSRVSMAIGDRLRRANPPTEHGSQRNGIRGGFLSFALVCLTATIQLVWARPSILIGGKLAAVTNVLMALIALASARQAIRDGEQWPSYGIRDLMVVSVAIAITLWWFWA